MDDRLPLTENLGATRCTVSIITTYSVDFHFYESVVLRRLNAAGCERHLLLVDADRCGEALADTSRRPRLAGVSYALVPVRRRGAFHPKLIVLAGKKTSRVFVGSHNLTLGGFGGNAEMTTLASATGSGSEGLVVRRALDAIADWLEPSGDGLAREILEDARQLVATGSGMSGGDAELFYSAPGRPPLWEQLRSRLPMRPSRVTILGPFFDPKLAFVQAVMNSLQPVETIVPVDPTYTQIPATHAKNSAARFVDARGVLNAVGHAESAPMHAKLLLVEHQGGSVLVTGSANPSAAAWLQEETNAEAVVVRTGIEADELAVLGLAGLYDAPDVTQAQWVEIETRIAEESASERVSCATPTALMATERDGTLRVEGVTEAPTSIGLTFGEDDFVDAVSFTYADGAVTVPPQEPGLQKCRVAEIRGGRGGMALVNHAAALAVEEVSSSSRADLQAALADVNADGVEEILKIVQRALDDQLDAQVIRAQRSPKHGDAKPDPDAEPSDLGPRAMRLADAKRRKHAPPVATGNIATVIDLLLRRVGEGLPEGTDPLPLREVEEDELEPVEREAARLPPATKNPELAKACKRRVGALLRRMVTRLEHAMRTPGEATRGVVQLAAVLGVLRWLRRAEGGLAWLPMGQTLVHEAARDDLFAAAGACLALQSPSLGDLVVAERPGGCEELSLVLANVAWLGRQAGIDIRNRSLHADEDEQSWLRWDGILIAVLARVAADEQAEQRLDSAFQERPTGERTHWLRFHRRLGDAMALACVDPVAVKCLARPVERGDLVVVRAPNGSASVGFVVSIDESKVWLLDANEDEGRRVQRKLVRAIDVNALA